MFVIAFDDHDVKKKNMDESKNPGWKLDSCLGGEWQRMAKGSRPHLERHTVSSWLELWQVPGIEELARNLDLKRINAGLSMPTHWSQSLTLCATMLSGPIYPPPSSMLEVFWETSSSATLPIGYQKLNILIKCKIEMQIWSTNGLLPPPVHGNQPGCCHRFCPKLHRLHHPQASLSVILGDQ